MKLTNRSMAELDRTLKTAHGNKRRKVLAELQRRWDQLFWPLSRVEEILESGRARKTPPCLRYDFRLLHG